MLDAPGRLGAEAVVAAEPISGARRASRKAQVAIEESAKQLELGRERWGGLIRGLAADLDLTPEALIRLVESAALELAQEDALTALSSARSAALTLRPEDLAVIRSIDRASAAVRGIDPNRPPPEPPSEVTGTRPGAGPQSA